jgi:hypothetical protein
MHSSQLLPVAAKALAGSFPIGTLEKAVINNPSAATSSDLRITDLISLPLFLFLNSSFNNLQVL